MIALVGFMGAGKTSVGRVLASRLGLPFIDTDREIERVAGMTVSELFAASGERVFRDMERDIAGRCLKAEKGVVALGGGAHLDPVTAAALEWATVVYLRTSFREVMRRVGDDPDRPLLRSRDPLALFEERTASYERIATVTVETDGSGIDEVAEEVMTRLGLRPAVDEGFDRIGVDLGPRSYEVIAGSGLLARLAELTPLPPGENAFVVTHGALETYAGAVESALTGAGFKTHRLTVPEGESSKSLASAGRLYDALAKAPAHRGDLVVAVGGGVIGDLAGFVASTYARGVAFLQVPTSLLAQVDAAVGGKTAVNLDGGKNLVGTFHQPVGVICDVDVLKTLPAEELTSGLAEVVKYGLISDPELLDFLEANSEALVDREPSVLREVVARSVAIKAAIVSSDETEQGERAFLNYGHTFAHAIEHARGYGGIRHGEAVAIGMMAAASLARELGRLDDDAVDLHRRSLRSVGLPVSAPLRIEELEEAWLRDKKYRDGVRFVLLKRIGRPEAGIAADRATIQTALERMEQ